MSKKSSFAKRTASCAVAAMLGLSSFGMGSIPVSAADTTITGDGEMNYVDMSKFQQVLLPTAGTMQFALDPQGLSTMATDTVSTKDLVADAGKIVSNGEVSIANYGYYPVKATVKLYVTDTGKSTLVSSPSEVDSDTTRKVCLTVTPSSAETTITADADGKVSATAGYAAGSEEIVINQTAVASAKSMVYALSGAAYNFKKDSSSGKDVYTAERDTTGKYGAASFKIGGAINKNADWADYIAAKSPKTLKLNAVFSYTSITEEEYAHLTDTTDGFVQTGTYNMIKDTDPEVATSAKFDPVKGSSVGLSLGTGATASTVTGVQFVKHTTKTKLDDSSDVPVKDAAIAVKGFTVNASGTALNIPAVPAIQTDLAKVDKTDSTYFNSTTSEYDKVGYEEGGYSYEFTYDLKVTFANKTTAEIQNVKMIEYMPPVVSFGSTALVKAATPTANKAIANTAITVPNYGNGGATVITKAVINAAKSTAVVSDVDNSKVTTAADGKVTIAASAFKYTSIATQSAVVVTVTFDSGETADVEIPVAAL